MLSRFVERRDQHASLPIPIHIFSALLGGSAEQVSSHIFSRGKLAVQVLLLRENTLLKRARGRKDLGDQWTRAPKEQATDGPMDWGAYSKYVYISSCDLDAAGKPTEDFRSRTKLLERLKVVLSCSDPNKLGPPQGPETKTNCKKIYTYIYT